MPKRRNSKDAEADTAGWIARTEAELSREVARSNREARQRRQHAQSLDESAVDKPLPEDTGAPSPAQIAAKLRAMQSWRQNRGGSWSRIARTAHSGTLYLTVYCGADRLWHWLYSTAEGRRHSPEPFTSPEAAMQAVDAVLAAEGDGDA
jgi:hypothetical protein